MRVIGTRVRERRRDKRLSVRPIIVELDGRRYETVDWGLGGFLIEPYEGVHMPDDTLYVRISAGEGDRARSHVVEARIVRLDRKYGELAGYFINMDDETFATLEGWMSGRLSRAANGPRK